MVVIGFIVVMWFMFGCALLLGEHDHQPVTKRHAIAAFTASGAAITAAGLVIGIGIVISDWIWR